MRENEKQEKSMKTNYNAKSDWWMKSMKARRETKEKKKELLERKRKGENRVEVKEGIE